MKKIVLITALSLSALAGIVYAGIPVKCWQCHGTGWNGSFKCTVCGGDGDTNN